jgi:superfamily II DNA or RNA helicase
MRELRDYQAEAVQAIINAWGRDDRRIAVVMATGLGKSTVIASTAATAAEMGLRVVMLAHRGELLTQMADTVKAVNPALDVGIVQADRDDHHHQIVAASFQTIAKDHRRERLGARDVILVDEVHHLPAATYVEAVKELGAGSGAFLCGFTATLSRSDGGLGDVIDKVVFERDIQWGIKHGYLVGPRGLTVKIPDLDLSKVKTVAGDFQQSALAEQMEASSGYVADAIALHASDRRSIVFAASVLGAQLITDALNVRGFYADYITGDVPREERERRYAKFRSGMIQHLVTVQVLTEGVDLPMCDAVVIARPTQSRVLFTQMVGRALRPQPGKLDALVLDLAGTTREIKLARLVDLDPAAPRKAIDLDGEPLDDDDPLLVDPPGPAQPKAKRVGPVELTPVDLMDAGRGILWLQLPSGEWFIPGRSRIVFVKPSTNETFWSVCDATARGQRVKVPVMTADHPFAVFPEFDEAIDAAEQHVLAHWPQAEVPYRNVSWRKRGSAPSPNQLVTARSLGIPDSDGMTRARVSDEISIKFAERTARWAL